MNPIAYGFHNSIKLTLARDNGKCVQNPLWVWQSSPPSSSIMYGRNTVKFANGSVDVTSEKDAAKSFERFNTISRFPGKQI